ncbi:MAG: hypothetical protein HFI38_01390 [Lachnospiraceae bacterium]|nr:hypothetical protein [Lachnospiraceae bacterium]
MQSEEDIRLKKRFTELAEKSFQQNQYLFTGFLGLKEQSLFFEARSGFPHVGVCLFGGNDFCERQMARFGELEELGYEEEFPIACVKISPAAPKYAEALTHRDYLGALINLGIERSTMGDILLAGQDAYVYCQNVMADFICDNLSRVKHTAVSCRSVEDVPGQARPHLREETVNVASERLDAVVSAVCKLSRSQSMELFRAGRIFVGGRMIENNSAVPKPGDIVSVRGYGRFVYGGAVYETKKGRYGIRVERYE